jgi:hypothetical protein
MFEKQLAIIDRIIRKNFNHRSTVEFAVIILLMMIFK